MRMQIQGEPLIPDLPFTIPCPICDMRMQIAPWNQPFEPDPGYQPSGIRVLVSGIRRLSPEIRRPGTALAPPLRACSLTGVVPAVTPR
jgi:hypothetical protein